MLWFGAALLHLSLLLVSPPLVRLSNAPLPRELKATTETGVVVVTGCIDANGEMENLQLVHGPAFFIQPSLDTVRRFEFEHAVLGNKTVPATAVFLYRAQTDLPNSAHIFSISANDFGTPGAPQPTTIVNPEYPLDSVAEGTVILQLTVDNNGKAANAVVINGVPSLTEAALCAVSQWKFTQEGVAVAVITFRRPTQVF